MKKILYILIIGLCSFNFAYSQKGKKIQQTQKIKTEVIKPAELIFAVLNDGTVIEPFAKFDEGELLPLSGETLDGKMLEKFASDYYKPRTAYKFVFGGIESGTVTVKSSNTKTECSKISANVTLQSPKAKPKGVIMGLATNFPIAETSGGLRRLPTPTERSEIESLIRSEFKKQKAGKEAIKNLRYHNLTALDVNNDGNAELIGSYWSQNLEGNRDLFFFIAEKNNRGKYQFGLSRFDEIKKENVMSGDFRDVEESAMLNELLLDTMEFNGDNSDEIFTVTKGFEGYSYRAYSRINSKWQKVFESYSYHCGY